MDLISAVWVGLIFSVERPDKELSRDRSGPIVINYASTRIEFPPDTNEATIARAIDDWLASENVLSKKIRDGVPLASYSDAELKRLHDRLNGRDHLDPWERDDLVLVGGDLAKKALAERPQPLGPYIKQLLSFTAGPPLLLLAFGFIITWVLKGFLPSLRAAPESLNLSRAR